MLLDVRAADWPAASRASGCGGGGRCGAPFGSGTGGDGSCGGLSNRSSRSSGSGVASESESEPCATGVTGSPGSRIECSDTLSGVTSGAAPVASMPKADAFRVAVRKAWRLSNEPLRCGRSVMALSELLESFICLVC